MQYRMTSDLSQVIKMPTTEDPRGYYIDPSMVDEWAAYEAWRADGNDPQPFPPQYPLPEAVKAECGRRIYEKVSDNAQKNLTANFVAGNLSADDQQAYKDGVAWIASMQETARTLIVTNELAFMDDAKWPVCPAASAELATRF